MLENYATWKFGTNAFSNGKISASSPYLKYTWTVRFEFEDGEPGSVEYGPITLKTCELPRWTIDTQVVNSYNKKTVVQTRLNFEPITMSLYDQQNDVAENLVWDYVKGQFDPNNASKAAGIRPMKITIKMHANAAGGLQRDENLIPPNDKTKEKIYVLRNAYIVDAQHDTLDYSTSDAVLWTITLRYEKIDWLGGFEGEESVTETLIPKAPEEFSQPVKNFSKPLSIEPIPDASPGLMEIEGFMGGDVNYGAINYKPTSLAKVLDERASREKTAKQISTPGADLQPTYNGYESAFVPTPPGPEARGFNASSGLAAAKTNTGTDSGSRKIDSSTAESASSFKKQEPKSISKEKPNNYQLRYDSNDPSTYGNEEKIQRIIDDQRDRRLARQSGKTVKEIREERERRAEYFQKNTTMKGYSGTRESRQNLGNLD